MREAVLLGTFALFFIKKLSAGCIMNPEQMPG
jgi:hypothetical protein